MTASGSLIGLSLPRKEAAQLVIGEGCFTDDINPPNVGHVAFLRSPYAHARIDSIKTEQAQSAPGVFAVINAAEVARVCKPWQTCLALVPGHTSVPQYPLADREVCWQGEPVLAIVAKTRAQAEDAIELIEIEWTELPAVVTAEAAAASPLVHTAASGNLGLDHSVLKGDPDEAFDQAAAIVEHEFSFGRQTGVTLETRTIIADFDPRLRRLTVYHSHQVPSQMREIFAAQLSLAPDDVRVVTPNVGGAFGMKLSAYPDEMAVAAIAILLKRQIKFCADRLESFVSDNHAREAKVRGRLALDRNGMLLGMEIFVVAGFGAYPAYPRGSVGEAMLAVHMAGAPYKIGAFRGSARGYFQNKCPTGILRAVGQPIACTVTEQLLDFAARKLGVEPAEIRQRNYANSSAGDIRSVGGIVLGHLSLQECHQKLLDLMDYQRLRDVQKELRRQHIYRGIGIAAFVEQTAVGPALYGAQQIRVSANEACRLALDTDGTVLCATSVTDQGQGTLTALRQIIAREVGIELSAVHVKSGDTDATPSGGGAWASRGTALGGEAALRAARKLKQNILAIAAALLQSQSNTLEIVSSNIVNSAGMVQMSLSELATAAFYRSHLVPLGEMPVLEVVESYAPRKIPYVTANGIQAAHVEVDVELGTVRILDFWVVEDCGRVINPMLVDEQIRGGVIQGIGAALYEQCVYGDTAQLENGSLADYLVPMASEMPDIQILHVETPTKETGLGARGVGEAGTVGAAAAIWTSVNDAISPFGATVSSQPITPEHILDSIAKLK